MGLVDPAEQEASEVLHSLLAVERVEKLQHIADEDGDEDVNVFSTPSSADESGDADAEIIQWQHQSPVTMSANSLFGNLDSSVNEQVILWDDTSQLTETIEQEHKHITIERRVDHVQETEDSDEEDEDNVSLDQRRTKSTKGLDVDSSELFNKTRKKQSGPQKTAGGNRRRGGCMEQPTKLEESSSQVKDRFKRGCDCMDESCFRGLNPENVYKHRLNIAELTKGEHDMYLMGVTMACLSNPDTTVRQKERRRLRAQYVYQGRRVCLDAFLYLENCTHYQLKRIRKHVMTHGVAPRVHGNHGKKPHNTFSLDIYKHATEFLKQYLEQHGGESVGGPGSSGKHPCIQLPYDITRKSLHDSYREYGQILEPGIKLMGYSTFRHFMKFQFPHVRFCKVEGSKAKGSHEPEISQATEEIGQHCLQISTGGEVQQMIPLVTVAHTSANAAVQTAVTGSATVMAQVQSPQTYIVTNVPAQGTVSAGTISYLNTGYAINEHGNIISTVTNTFNRI